MRCDLVVAAEHIEFGLPEVQRGLVAGAGVTILPRRIPMPVVLELGLVGSRISAQRALRARPREPGGAAGRGRRRSTDPRRGRSQRTGRSRCGSPSSSPTRRRTRCRRSIWTKIDAGHAHRHEQRRRQGRRARVRGEAPSELDGSLRAQAFGDVRKAYRTVGPWAAMSRRVGAATAKPIKANAPPT